MTDTQLATRYDSALVSGLEAKSTTSWPQSCRYYDPKTINLDKIRHLLLADTSYASVNHPLCTVSSLVMQNGQRVRRVSADNAADASHIINHPTPHGSTTVIYVRQVRIYSNHQTTSRLYLDIKTWGNLLERFHVIPEFLETLHDNNGCTSCHTTPVDSSPHTPISPHNTAIHACFKIGNWGDNESAIYARHEFDTDSSFILIVGTLADSTQRLEHLYTRNPDARLFHGLFEHFSAELNLVNEHRLKWDFATQDLEAKTGFCTFRTGVPPLSTDELAYDRDSYFTLDGLRDVSWGALQVHAVFRALATYSPRYEDLRQASAAATTAAASTTSSHGTTSSTASTALPSPPAVPPSAPDHSRLQSAIAAKSNVAESCEAHIGQLTARVRNQIEVIRTLITQRDMQLSLELAAAAKRDSEIMRSIAAVTMIFLPATFVATFFSMVFFFVDEGDGNGGSAAATTTTTAQETLRGMRLVVDESVWLYPVVTVPLTIGVAIWYFSKLYRRLFLLCMRALRWLYPGKRIRRLKGSGGLA